MWLSARDLREVACRNRLRTDSTMRWWQHGEPFAAQRGLCPPSRPGGFRKLVMNFLCTCRRLPTLVRCFRYLRTWNPHGDLFAKDIGTLNSRVSSLTTGSLVAACTTRQSNRLVDQRSTLWIFPLTTGYSLQGPGKKGRCDARCWMTTYSVWWLVQSGNKERRQLRW